MKKTPLLPALLCLALAAGCGKKGPPLPPLPTLYPRLSEVTLMQRGEEVILSWRVLPPVGEGKPARATRCLVQRAPAGEAADTAEIEESVARGMLETVAEIEVPEEAAAGSFRWTDPDSKGRSGAWLYSVSVVTTHKNREVRGDILRYRAVTPPPPLLDFRAEAVPEGILLAWLPPEADDLTVRIYRAAPGEAVPDRPWDTSEETGRHLDASVTLGGSYEYHAAAHRVIESATALEILGSPEEGRQRAPWAAAALLSESVLAGPARAMHLDLYPPPVPGNLRAFPQEDLVVLLWNPVESPDLAGYHIYRAEEGGDPSRLTEEPLADTVHRDTTALPGIDYAYTVTSVDRTEPPNESAPSEEARAALPTREETP